MSLVFFLAAALSLSDARPVPAHDQPHFAQDLTRVTSAGSANVAVSAWSLGRLLALFESGARGETASELHAVLHAASPDSQAEYVTLGGALRPPEGAGRARREPDYELALASSLWHAQDLALVPDFALRARSSFATECTALDFGAPDARDRIHAWVSGATQGRIREILPAGQPTAASRLVLVDTLHLVARWETPFEESATKPAPFTRADGSRVEVPFMHRTLRTGFGTSALAQVAALRYDGGLELLLALPQSAGGLDELLAREGAADWGRVLERKRVELALPKCTFESSHDLVPALRALGVSRTFDAQRAEFEGLCSTEPLFVAIVVQRVRIAFDERGTEATAATATTMRTGASQPPTETPVPFHLDRPYAFALRHASTGVVLFSGCVRDPSAK